jgi:quercetin dioxygenase-like cupin family protein
MLLSQKFAKVIHAVLREDSSLRGGGNAMSETPKASTLGPAEAVALAALTAYAPGAVVSRTLIKKESGNLTLFAFDAGQGLSEHSAPFDAVVYIVEGWAELRIGGQYVRADVGNMVLMPANVPHALQAVQPTKLLLIMFKG